MKFENDTSLGLSQVDVGQPEDPTKRRSSIQGGVALLSDWTDSSLCVVVSTLVNDMTVKFWALKRQ